MTARLCLGQPLPGWPSNLTALSIQLQPSSQSHWQLLPHEQGWQLLVSGPILELCQQLQPAMDEIWLNHPLTAEQCHALANLLRLGGRLYDSRPENSSAWRGAGLVWQADHWQQQQSQGPKPQAAGRLRLWQARQPSNRDQPIAVLGAGIAGVCTAQALAKLGYQVHLYDRQGESCQEASGNRQGVLYIKPSKKSELLAQFQWQAWQYSQALLAQSELSSLDKGQSGLLLLGQHAGVANNPLYRGSYQPLSPEQASSKAGWPVDQPALWLDQCAWVHPKAWAQQLLKQAGIQCRFHRPCQLQAHDQGWLVDNEFYTQLVICTGIHSSNLAACQHLSLQAIQGWVSHYALKPGQQGPDCILCAKGYVTPSVAGQLHFGASYGLNLNQASEQPKDQAHNLERLAELGAPFVPDAKGLTGRAGVRAATHDTLPLLGAIAQTPERLAWQLAHDQQQHECWQPGLWINSGHGSRGLSTAPLSAAVVACQIAGLPVPLSQQLFFATLAERRALKHPQAKPSRLNGRT